MTGMFVLSVSKMPNRTSLISNLTAIFKELSATFQSSQNIHTFVQWKKRCSMVSSSFSQKSHKREFTSLNLLVNSMFVYKILFNILYWNSLNLVSSVALKGSRYIFSQPTLGCVCAESFVVFLLHCWYTIKKILSKA